MVMPSPAPRRTRSSVPGVYYRINAVGRRTYEFTYRDGAGRQRWQCGYATLAAACDERSALQRRRRRGERIVPTKATFAEFARDWLATQHHLRPSTRERYRWAIDVHLIPVFGRHRLAEIREDDVARAYRRDVDHAARVDGARDGQRPVSAHGPRGPPRRDRDQPGQRPGALGAPQ